MKNRKKRQKKLSALVLLLAITIGYALLSTTLKINGIANINSNTWDIHFENVQPNTSSTVTAETPSITDNATKVSYEVTLELPGDYYEFTVDAVNDGSINGEITKVDHKVYPVVNGVVGTEATTLPSYVHSTIYYDGTTTPPAEGDILDAGATKKYRVRIEYDSEATTLPSSDLTYLVVDEIKYTQTKENESGIPPKVQNKMNRIIANPDNYRDEDQSSTNKDIGLDENGNVINLDMWVGIDKCAGEKLYYMANYDDDSYPNDEVYIGKPTCSIADPNDESEYGFITPATSSAQVVNGVLQTPIPAYIMFAGTDTFYPVTEIESLFGHSTGRDVSPIKHVPYLPNTIKTIGGNSFYATDIEDVVIPKHVKYVYGFNNSSSVVSLSFENGSEIEEIGGGAFSECSLTGNLTFPKSLKKIDYSAFARNNISSLSFESGSRLTSIGDSAFYENSLESLSIPASLKTIGRSAFDDNYDLSTLSFANGSVLERIDDYAFDDCNLSGDLVLPQTVNYIGRSAFDNNNLTSVTFPSSAEYFSGGYSNSFDEYVVINHQY